MVRKNSKTSRFSCVKNNNIKCSSGLFLGPIFCIMLLNFDLISFQVQAIIPHITLVLSGLSLCSMLSHHKKVESAVTWFIP